MKNTTKSTEYGEFQNHFMTKPSTDDAQNMLGIDVNVCPIVLFNYLTIVLSL